MVSKPRLWKVTAQIAGKARQALSSAYGQGDFNVAIFYFLFFGMLVQGIQQVD